MLLRLTVRCFVLLAACCAVLPGCSSVREPAAVPNSVVAHVDAPDAGEDTRRAPELGLERPEPHPAIPVGTKLVAYVGPRFLTGDSFLPEARAVIADETGRVRALLRQVPPPEAYPQVTLRGALAVPGLHDAHVHLAAIGETEEMLALHAITDIAGLRSALQEWMTRHPGAKWVHGHGWDQTHFKEQRFPTWKDIDGVTSVPVWLDRIDGHAGLANAALLRAAGISTTTADPPGGRLLRDDRGEPTGVLIDHAMALIDPVRPAVSASDREEWLFAGMRACQQAGLVAVHDMGMAVDDFDVLARLNPATLPLRVFVYLDGTDPRALDRLHKTDVTAPVQLMGIKIYVDGAMGSRGAALLAPYSDEPTQSGNLLITPDALRAKLHAVHALGFAAAIHAIGDRANAMALDALAAEPPPAGAHGPRDRIEHAQLVAPGDFARFEHQRVVASMQPTHATSDMRWVEARIGSERLKGAYAWRTMLTHHVALAFGSDTPVEDEHPALGIYAAITRQDRSGQPPQGFTAAERLTQREALAAFSAGAAYAVGLEQHAGALTPGMFLDVSLFTLDAAAATDAGDPSAWLRTRPVGTLVGGKPPPNMAR